MRTRQHLTWTRPLAWIASGLLLCAASAAAQDTPQRAGPDPAGPPPLPPLEKGGDPLDPAGGHAPRTPHVPAPRAASQDWPAWPPTTPSPDGKPGAFLVQLHYGEQATPLDVTVVLPEGWPHAPGDAPGGDPARAAGAVDAPLPVLIALPPGAGDAKMCAASRELYWDAESRTRGRLLLVPQILGKKLQQDAPDVAAALYGWLDARVPYDRAHVTLTGVSNGGLGAFFLALAAPERLSALMVLPGAYEGPAEDLARLKEVPVRLVVGGLDEDWQRLTEHTLANLQAAGVIAERAVVSDQDHVIHVPPGELFKWIDEHEVVPVVARGTRP